MADFDTFVTRLQTEQDDLKRFWEAEKDEFVTSVDDLYAQIESYLGDYTSDGRIRIEYRQLELHEEDTGVYQTRKCIITIGHRSVLLNPVGTQLIGMKGRVDVSGGFGRSRLVLVDANLKTFRLNVEVRVNGRLQGPSAAVPDARDAPILWTWRIVSQPPNMVFTELNRENFLDLLMGVSDA